MNHPFFKLDSRLVKLGEQAMEEARTAFAGIEEMQEYNQQKMLAAFIHNGVKATLWAVRGTGMTTAAGKRWMPFLPWPWGPKTLWCAITSCAGLMR